MTKLRDKDIRQIILKRLDETYKNDNSTKIVNEMGILHGKSRIDIAVINGILHGFEIKSESDTLTRLPSQIRDYNKVFDRMTIVIQNNFLNEIRGIIPKWWGIWLITGNLSIREIRKGKTNNEIDLESLSHLLWKNEAIELLKEKGLHKGYLSKPRSILYERMAEKIEKSELQFMINERLKSREAWKVQI